MDYANRKPKITAKNM
nr:unnamed protein product [Callosobruchus analis]